MPRPSHNLDQKLLDAGRSIILEDGLSHMSLRAVAKRAHVNLGMFHYYFKDKEEFSQRCCGEAYAEFYRSFEMETSGPGGTLEKMRRGLTSLAKFSRNQRHFILAMMKDLGDKNPDAWGFIRSRFPPPHGKVLMELIRQGQKEGIFIKAPLSHLMSAFMGAIIYPHLMGGLAERVAGSSLLDATEAGIKEHFLSDEALETRVELVLRALLKEAPQKLPRSRRKK